MPGPGPHMMYTLGAGQALMSISNGRFSPHHCLVYAINAFFGPDMGSFSEWLTSTLGLGRAVGSAAESFIHHPIYYTLLLGFPFSVLYSWISRILLRRGLLDSISGVGYPVLPPIFISWCSVYVNFGFWCFVCGDCGRIGNWTLYYQDMNALIPSRGPEMGVQINDTHARVW